MQEQQSSFANMPELIAAVYEMRYWQRKYSQLQIEAFLQKSKEYEAIVDNALEHIFKITKGLK